MYIKFNALQNGLTDDEQYEMDLGPDLYQKVKPYFKPATDVKVVEKLGRGRSAKIKKSFFNGKIVALKYPIGKLSGRHIILVLKIQIEYF